MQPVEFILILPGHVKLEKKNETIFLKLPVVSRFISFSDTEKLVIFRTINQH